MLDEEITELKSSNCQLCKRSVEGHPRCQACMIFMEGPHISKGVMFRDHYICKSCEGRWLMLEKKHKKTITWKLMLSGVSLPKQDKADYISYINFFG